MIGSILKNIETNKKLGCVVHYNPSANQAVIFRATSPDHPSFGRVNLNNLGPSVQVEGNINDYQNGDIKQYLLRYLRTRNLSPTEDRVIRQVRDYAFPNGLPKYDSASASTDIEGERQGMGLDMGARPGKCMYINTPAISPFQHLDNHKVYIISRDDGGLWVCTMDSSSPITSYLPFKVRSSGNVQDDTLSCHGISRMMPLDEKPSQSRLDTFSQLDNEGVSQIIVKGTRVKVVPRDGNRIIIPSTSEYKGKYYDYRIGDIVDEPHNIMIASTSSGGIMNALDRAKTSANMANGDIVGMFDNEAPIKPASNGNNSNGNNSNGGNSNGSGDGYIGISSGVDNSEPMLVVDETGESDHDGLLDILDSMEAPVTDTNNNNNNNNDANSSTNDGDADTSKKPKQNKKKQSGGASDSGLDTDVEDDVLDSEVKAIMQEDAGLRKSVRDVESGDNIGVDMDSGDNISEDGEPELEFVSDDEEVEELGVFQKVRQMPVPETDKVYKESIQRGRLLKQKLEKIPAVLRENPYWLNRIRKEVNTISLIKALGTVVDKGKIASTDSRVVLRVPDFRPLVEKMMNRDFTNQLLIPLVAARKRVYLHVSDTIGASEFDPDNTDVIEDTYDRLNKEELLVEKAASGGIIRRQVNIDDELGRQITENVPETAHNNTMGLLFRLGEGIQPELSINQPSGTSKLQGQRAVDRQMAINQDATVIRYGGGDAGMDIQGYSIEQTAFDTFVALGPLARYVNDSHNTLSMAEIEAMEDQVDRNMDVNSSKYKVFYTGDNLSLLGFVRPPISSVYANQESSGDRGLEDSLRTRLNEAEKDGNVLVRRIDKRYVDKEDNDLDVMENPDKFIMYIIPMDGKTHLDDTIMKKQLTKIIPDVKTYLDTMVKQYHPKTPEDIGAMVTALNKLEYFYPNNSEVVKIWAASSKSLMGLGNIVPPKPSTELTAMSYVDYEPIRAIEEEVAKRMKDLSAKLDRMIKLGKYRKTKTKENKAIVNSINASHGKSSNDDSKVKNGENKVVLGSKGRKGIVIPDDLVEMANTIYGDKGKYNVDLSVPIASMEEITRLEFYALQPDNGQYMNLLIHLGVLEKLEKDLDKSNLEMQLQSLKDRYDAEVGGTLMSERMDNLKPALRDKLQACRRRIDRKPKIMKYPSLERLESDNGHVITNARGEVIQSGDYAIIAGGGEDGQHLIYKREQLATGDYWLSQPINALEDLLKKKKDSCASAEISSDNNNRDGANTMRTSSKETLANATKEDLLQLPDERCLFDVSKIECMPDEMANMDINMANLEAHIADVKGQLDMALAVPVMIKEVKDSMRKYEKQISALSNSTKAVRKYKAGKDKEIAQALIAMRNKKQDCPHFKATEYLDSLKNITVTERYHLVQKILDIYADQEQSASLNLDEVAGDPDANYIRCHVCSQNLMCKHNAFAITMLQGSVGMDNIDDGAGQIDDEVMSEKYGHEVTGSIYCRICGYFLSNTAVQDIEEYEKKAGKEGFHAKTREVIDARNVVEQQRDAIAKIMREALTTETSGDMKFQLRIYKLLKNLSGLDMLSVEDELDMINFIKSSSFIPKKVFYTRLYVMFLRLKKQAPAAVIDKLASNQYWLHVTADIMAKYLVILQTSRQTYQVYNSLCVNNIMGWPLLKAARNQPGGRSGLEFMSCLAKQMVLAPGGDFAYLNPVEKFPSILEKRVEELIANDSYTRDKLEQALDDKYMHITFLDEMANAPATQWLTFRPAISFWEGGVKWQPAGGQPPSMDSIFKDWQPGSIARVKAAVRDNIAYQSQLLSADLAKVVGESEPTTRFTLTSSIGNGCCPIDVNKERERTGAGKYGNPMLSYYMLPIRHIPEIGNHIRKITEYERSLAAINRVLYHTRYRILSSRPDQNWYKVPMLDMGTVSQDIVHSYFMTYVDSPSKQTSHGRMHLFDAFGRCLVSNQLKDDLDQVNYTEGDFRRLSRVVAEKQIIFKQPLDISGIRIHTAVNMAGNTSSIIGLEYETSCMLASYMSLITRLITLTGKQPKGIPRLECPHLEKIERHVKEALQPMLVAAMAVNPVLYSSVEMIIRELRVITESLEQIQAAAISASSAPNEGLKSFAKWRVMWDILTKTCHLLCAKFEEATIQHMNIAIFPKEMRVKDMQRKYFDLISMLDTHAQNQIDNLVDIIGLNQKDENELELVLANVGDLKEIRVDYEAYLDKQLDIIPRLGGAYLNRDILISKRSAFNRVKFLVKMLEDLTQIAHLLSNKAWSGFKTENEIISKYSNITDFFQYKNNFGLISRIKPLSRQVSDLVKNLASEVYPLPQLIQTEPGILQSEFLSSIAHYSLLWLLNQYMELITGDANKKVSTLMDSLDSSSSSPSSESVKAAVAQLEAERESMVGPTPEELVAMNGMSEEDLELYPELIVEGREVDNTGFTTDTNDDDDTTGEDSNTTNEDKDGKRQTGSGSKTGRKSYNFHQKLVETRDSNKNIMISYVRDCIIYLDDNHNLANDLNITVIAQQMAKIKEQQVRRNLRAFKFLNEEGREDDYKMIKQMMVIGRLDYGDLDDYMQANFPGGNGGDPDGTGMFIGEEDDREAKNYNKDQDNGDDLDQVGASEQEAKKDRLGFSDHEHDEMGYVGEAEDMEGGDFDYGYIGVD